ncbi:hypothetical protein [Georgfuchsia toluolica]|uniref:hypothetical protein n=1 Tax=Georgfuchsia toluolica TaxID=424218 RepID=UPI001C72A346|nr:hypothetical protein [Georgfuchsia toluolica]
MKWITRQRPQDRPHRLPLAGGALHDDRFPNVLANEYNRPTADLRSLYKAAIRLADVLRNLPEGRFTGTIWNIQSEADFPGSQIESPNRGNSLCLKSGLHAGYG